MIKKTVILVTVLLGMTNAFAQDLIVPQKGEPINAYNLEQSVDYLFFTKENSADSPILRIAKTDVLMVRKADGSVLSLNSQIANNASDNGKESQSDFPIINESDIHGSLIEQGNCVYIPTDSPFDYEQAGQQKVKEMVTQWGYWKVVNKPEQAHFILQFTTQTSGSDVSILIIRPRKYYAQCPTVVRDGIWGGWKQGKKSVGVTVNWRNANENPSENRKNAVIMVEHMKKLIAETNDKESKNFYKYHSKALDADAVSNDSSGRCIYAD